MKTTRKAPPNRAPKVTVEGLRYSFTVEVTGIPRQSFSGTTLAELQRDAAKVGAALKGSR